MSAARELVITAPECYKELDQPYRYKIAYGGRGAARSWTFARKLLGRGMCKKLLILCTRELQKSIDDSVYRLLVNQIELMGLGYHYPEELRTKKSILGRNGTEFIFMGTRHHVSEIKSLEGVDIIWIEEAHSLTTDSWDLIDPTIRKEEDGWTSEIWATFNTRFKFDTLYQKFVVQNPPDDSLVIFSSFEDNPYLPKVLAKQQAEMCERDYENWLHIWKGNLKELSKGAVFGNQITEVKKSHRHTFITIEKSCEVETFNDVGKSDPCAWWFLQNAGGQLRFIDYYHARFEDIDHYVRVLKALGYNYGRHWMPHDADHDRLGMVRNIKEQFEDGGIRPIEIVPRITDKEIAIQQGRDIMSKCWFHHHVDDRPENECEGYIHWLPEGWRTRAQRMERGWEMICNYRYKYNDDSGEFGIKPHHDIASNAADAYMQFAQSYEPPEADDWFNKPLPNDSRHIV